MSRSTLDEHVTIDLPEGVVQGELAIPDDALGLIIFAHGSGSSRHSSRNQHVAAALNRAALGTLLFDLLTEEETRVDGRTRHMRFDVELLARRLCTAVAQTRQYDLPIGLFGASTGAAAALIAAARNPEVIGAVVSRGGRPDLAGDALLRVHAPTLLIVGGLDAPVIELNRNAAERMTGTQRRVQIVPGASHLFEEPGTLDQAAQLARDWFVEHLM